MPAANQSRARLLAIAVAELLAVYVGERATMMTLWHPSFTSKSQLENTIINVRPASRGRTDDSKVTGPRDVVLEVCVVRHLPKPASAKAADAKHVTLSQDDLDVIDELDALTEELFDLFVRTDPEEKPEGSTVGELAQRTVWKYTPGESPQQPSTLENAVLESDRLFLSVFTVPYRRWE